MCQDFSQIIGNFQKVPAMEKKGVGPKLSPHKPFGNQPKPEVSCLKGVLAATACVFTVQRVICWSLNKSRFITYM